MDDNDHNDHNNIDDDNLANARRQSILLTPEGQQLFDVLESYIKKELPPYTNSKMNEMVNNMAAEGGEGEEEEFLSTVRASVVACLFGRDDNNEIITDEQRGLTTTIIDKEEWPKEEKRIETALRLFPDILLEKKDGYYPIQWLAMREDNNTYNLKNISLIPMVIELGSELEQFAAELRGGLLSLSPTDRKPLENIICYFTKNNETNVLRDDCFSTVRNWMRKNNLLVTEDIQQHNLVGTMCLNTPNFSASRLRYLINMDPVSLTLPCNPEKGSMLPIHWSIEEEDIGIFSMLLKAGMKYYPDKFGFVFGEGTHRNNSTEPMFREIPFQEACKQYGQEKGINEVIDCIKEYCSTSSSTLATTTTTTTITETSLLMSAITDATIHIDGVYILLRKDPEAALLKLQQKLRLLVREGVHTVTDTNTHTNTNTTNSSNNKNTNGVISNDNDNDTTLCVLNSTSSSSSTTNTITAAATATAVVSISSSTANINNNNNNDDNHIRNYSYNRDNGNASHQPSSSSSSPHLNGKKRKHKMV